MLTSMNIYLASILIILHLATSVSSRGYGRGFLNHTGCLYSYLEGGNFEMTTANNEVISETLDLESLNYDPNKSRCVELDQAGKIVFSFKMDEKSLLKSITISMRITTSPSEGIWEIPQANLTVTRAGSDKRRTFPLGVVGLYASSRHSFSCNEFVLETIRKRRPDNETDKAEPRAIITLDRFQLQPFAELQSVVFAASFDCSVWINVPGLMGLILILFVIAVTALGVIFLRDIQTNDFKYNKEGLLFTQSQMESNKSR